MAIPRSLPKFRPTFRPRGKLASGAVMNNLLQRGGGVIPFNPLVFDEEFTSRNFNTDPLTIPDLEGDAFDYEVIIFIANASGDSNLDVTFNSDAAAASYRNYESKGLASTGSAAVGDTDNAIALQSLIGTFNPNLLLMNISGSSGNERYVSSFYSGDGAVLKQSSYWKDTIEELDEITLTATNSVTCDAHIIIYKTPKDNDQGNWELVDTLSWSAESSEKSFTGLAGDTDIQYRVVWSGDQELDIELNDDGTAKYTRQYMQNSAGTLSAANTTTDTSIVTDGTESTVIINAESGVKRLCTITSSDKAAAQQSERAIWYDDTVTEITTIDCTPVASTTGMAKLYKLKDLDATGDILPFETLETVNVSGDFSTGHTFSNLEGDSATLYKLEWLGDASVFAEMDLRPNNDSTAGNYSVQQLRAQSGSIVVFSGAVEGRLTRGTVSDQCHVVWYIYPKSGENRPALSISSRGENTLELSAGWWTDSIDEITSLFIATDVTNTLTGTLKLSRLIS